MNAVVANSLDPARLSAFCARWKIARLELFGSAARGEAGPDSDLDILVTFRPEARWSLLKFVRMERELADLAGRQVDLVEREAVVESNNAIRKRSILDSAKPLFDA
ncbi:MAG: nucleotidyltransferase family protein [Alphaproteobacteria bacterium]|nr:nucleotidyltransferase family protein [Alphaproteobacteria bacterium]